MVMERPATRAPQSDPRTDLELIEAVNGGGADAFEALYYRYRDWVASLAFRITGDHSLAMDVLQETFLYVIKKFPGFRLTAQFKTFLYPAVRNFSVAARRKAHRHQSSEHELAALQTAAAPEAVSTDAEVLAGALELLTEEHREVLRLRFVDGLKLDEIATAMNLPLGTVKSRSHYALEALRQDPRTRILFES